MEIITSITIKAFDQSDLLAISYIYSGTDLSLNEAVTLYVAQPTCKLYISREALTQLDKYFNTIGLSKKKEN